MVTLRVENLPEIIRALLALKTPAMFRIADSAAGKWLKRVRLQLFKTRYPPKRAGQRYVRTGMLGSSWSTSVIGPGRYQIKNSRTYARYVVGDHMGRGQAWMHKGRWWIALERIQQVAPDLADTIAAAIEEHWERLPAA